MKAASFLAAAAVLAVAGIARADFAEGLAAFDAGDYRTAFEEWRALAVTGDAEAQVALAGLYLDGNGVTPDAATAARWYVHAAEQGEPVAQLNLGDFYARGIGVRRDLAAAYFWLSLSAEQGRRWALLRRREIARFMTAEQISEAEARLAAWRSGR